MVRNRPRKILTHFVAGGLLLHPGHVFQQLRPLLCQLSHPGPRNLRSSAAFLFPSDGLQCILSSLLGPAAPLGCFCHLLSVCWLSVLSSHLYLCPGLIFVCVPVSSGTRQAPKVAGIAYKPAKRHSTDSSSRCPTPQPRARALSQCQSNVLLRG